MQSLITILHLLTALALIALILLQHGKGADIGAAFGSGASNTMFGSQGTTPFLVKITAILAFVFFVTSSSLSFIVYKQAKKSNLIQTPIASEPVKSDSVVPSSVPPSALPPTGSSSTSSQK